MLVAVRGLTSEEKLDDLKTRDWLYVASDSLDIVVAILAVIVARRITHRLDARRAAIERPADGISPPAAEAAPQA